MAKVQPEEWVPHYNERDFGGDWRGAALRSASGSTTELVAMPAGSREFRDTPLLSRCPAFREALAVFECPLKSARLLSLAPGSFIREHSDHALGYEDGEIRIHIPIQTNPGVEFYVAGERLLLEAGNSYFVNVNMPHRVNNRGTADRVHLVIDADVNEWVHALFGRCLAEGRHIRRSALPARSLEDFRGFVLDNPDPRNRLREISDRREFISSAIALGRRRGYDFNEADVEAGLRGKPIGRVELPGAGWTPIRFSLRDSQPYVEWVYTGERRFTESFFDDTVKKCLRDPFPALFRIETPLADSPGLAPSGFIFHISRCGSTLISQMLATLESTVMISEAPAIDEAIQAGGDPRWLQAMVAALGQRRTGIESQYVIKLDAWHIHSLPLIRAAFPDTPWVFLYRDPVEVVVSHLRNPGRQTIPRNLEEAASLRRDEWCARVVGDLCRAALPFRDDPKALFVNYRDLPMAVFGPIRKHFGLAFDAAEEANMLDTARFNAKDPGLPFQSDSSEKRRVGLSILPPGCVVELSALYHELELHR